MSEVFSAESRRELDHAIERTRTANDLLQVIIIAAPSFLVGFICGATIYLLSSWGRVAG